MPPKSKKTATSQHSLPYSKSGCGLPTIVDSGELFPTSMASCHREARFDLDVLSSFLSFLARVSRETVMDWMIVVPIGLDK